MEIANLIGGVVLLFIGILVRVFKLSDLIAGYNTASPEEKSRYDKESLTRAVGYFLILLGAILLAGWGLVFFGDLPSFIAIVSWMIFAVIMVGGLIYLNTGNRYRKKD